MKTPTVEEPIADSWRLATELAARHCEGCGWYHGLWQYLRVIGMGKTLSGQSAWFLDQIKRYRGRPHVSVLISGCADYSAFAHAIAGLGLGRDSPTDAARIVAVDRCNTPLELNRHLSEKTGVPIVNHCEDILDFETDDRFDLIFTSSFMGFFTPAQRVQLFRKYLRLLVPGGELVTANRTKEGLEDTRVQFTQQMAEDAIKGALELNRLNGPADGMADSELEPRIRNYVESWGTYPLNSRASIENALRAAGYSDFSIEERMPTLPQEKVKLVGNTFAERTPFMCVVARRVVNAVDS